MPSHVHANAMKKGRIARSIALIVASACALAAAEPPAGFLRKIAERETENARAMENYTYRQSLSMQEFNVQGAVVGEYREVRDVTFSPIRGRYEQVVEPAHSTLTRVRLTAEDYNDIRNIDPFMLTADKVSLYEGRYQGEQTIDGAACFV